MNPRLCYFILGTMIGIGGLLIITNGLHYQPTRPNATYEAVNVYKCPYFGAYVGPGPIFGRGYVSGDVDYVIARQISNDTVTPMPEAKPAGPSINSFDELFEPSADVVDGASLLGPFDGFGIKVLQDASANRTIRAQVFYHFTTGTPMMDELAVLCPTRKT